MTPQRAFVFCRSHLFRHVLRPSISVSAAHSRSHSCRRRPRTVVVIDAHIALLDCNRPVAVRFHFPYLTWRVWIRRRRWCRSRRWRRAWWRWPWWGRWLAVTCTTWAMADRLPAVPCNILDWALLVIVENEVVVRSEATSIRQVGSSTTPSIVRAAGRQRRLQRLESVLTR